MYKNKKAFLGALFVMFSLQVFSQTGTYQLVPLELNEVNEFANVGKNWSIVGDINASFEDTQFKSKSGKGILMNTITPKDKKYQSSQNIFTKLEHSDIYLEMDFMMAKGSNSGIYLQSRYEIQLYDSWGIKNPHPVDCGSIYDRWDEKRPEGLKGYEGHAPLQNACLAPGLWQHLQIEFQAPKFNASGIKTQNAKFVKVILNGVVVQENIYLSGPTRSGIAEDEKAVAPLMIQGDHGTVAFKNIKYAKLGTFEASLKDVAYEYYEGNFDSFDKATSAKLTRKGNASGVDFRLSETPNNMCLFFNGKLNVPETGDYEFIIVRNGFANLTIDGVEIIKPVWKWMNENSTGKINLKGGEHTFKLGYLKNTNWGVPALGLFIQKANFKPVALHVGASLPEPEPVPQIEINPKTEPEIIRSFLMYKGRKLTHVISVGDPAGVNYSYNLNQGGLLQVWKGNFLNATEMWFERGEPQIAQALGGAVVLSGKSPLEILSGTNIVLHDSIDDRKELIYQGYKLDINRYPTFQYKYNETGFTDSFKPYQGNKGIIREVNLTSPASEKVFFKLAEGSKIETVGAGLFAIDGQKYYIQVINSDIKPIIHKYENGFALLIQGMSGKKHVSNLKYVIYW